MIAKIKQIKQLAVFQHFDWDSSVKDKEGQVCELKEANILFGRNYSGKTSLSRIMRAFEVGKLPEKCGAAKFVVEMKDGAVYDEVTLATCDKVVRVFNEDFIKENLKFIADPEKSIVPFAVVGGDNNKIEEQIKLLEEKIGSKEQGKECGMYADAIAYNNTWKAANLEFERASNALESQLSDKAIKNPTGIKYNFKTYGEQNYNIGTLKKEIGEVLKSNFVPINNEEKAALEKLLDEKVLEENPPGKALELNFKSFISQTEEHLAKNITSSEKIPLLLKDALLSNWVEDGYKKHKDIHQNCAFCGSPIKETRWGELERHFDEESTKLKQSISKLVEDIENEIARVLVGFEYKQTDFYARFHPPLETLKRRYDGVVTEYITSCKSLIEQLHKKRDNLFDQILFSCPADYSEQIEIVLADYRSIITESNTFAGKLRQEQRDAQRKLRFREISDFLSTIRYDDELKRIETLRKEAEEKKQLREEVGIQIKSMQERIEALKLELEDQSKGAEKVNEYLRNFFGHQYLSLRVVDKESTGGKEVHFEVIREGKKAYHLSEGECSFIAFCYFMARLDDSKTKDAKPIIWIDDPISSLDSNHIFFVYSLINSKIVSEKRYEQLFISTHNLDFLKYLKRLPGANEDFAKKEGKKKYQYLIVQRLGSTSTLSLMPKYLREYVTEFNYLFHQIYKCSSIEVEDDSNYEVYYNFGNNARKFLEIYLYYRYPDSSKDTDKMKRFFGNEDIPPILTDRINNEYSHLAGVFERGATPIVVAEMKKVAELIVNKLKADNDQFNALMRSVGELAEEPAEEEAPAAI